MTSIRGGAHWKARPIAALLAATALAGCGGSAKPSDTQLVKQALRSYLAAQAAGDGQQACGLLTSAAQQKLEALVVSGSGGLIAANPSCADAVRLVRTVAGSQLLGALNNARIENVQVTGLQASAEVVDGGQFQPQQVTLDKTSGSWKIAAAPGLGS